MHELMLAMAKFVAKSGMRLGDSVQVYAHHFAAAAATSGMPKEEAIELLIKKYDVASAYDVNKDTTFS